MSGHTKAHIPYCKNCHYPLAEFDKFCPHCGQKKTDGKISMHDLFHEIIHLLWHVDGRFFWTLKHIFIPGKLTLEFFKGHHKRYAHPIQLFLVLGVLAFGFIASTSFKKNKNEKFTKEEQVFRKQVLLELDSIKHTLPEYKTPSVAKAIDTLLLRGNSGVNDKTEAINRTKEELKKNIAKTDSLRRKLTQRLDDSVRLAATDSISKDLIEDLADLRDDLKEAQGDSAGSQIALNTLNLLSVGNGKEKKQNMLYTNIDEGDRKKALFNQDSMQVPTIFWDTYKISRIDLYHKTEDELAEQCQVKGFLQKIAFKQYLKVQKSGANSISAYFFSKLVWLTALAILPMALIYQLLYRKQERYYVEHVVFLLHYSVLIFAIIILLMLMQKLHLDALFSVSNTIAILFLFFFAMPMAMKRFYGQSWSKTIIKFLIAGFAFLIVASISMLIGLAISFVLFS